ncbi:MAG: toll/interleukin-1 receptor domain-containing protein [Ignavibacteriales bacterium]|nr:MAG: toll/interleukin-1 receptor domain-containing protein [Ignavibacteriales bacterium]
MERINKPRVFLSYSSNDKEFVKKAFDDLMRCQITPWRDEIEIRTGKSFLKTIFEDGIPTCDSVLVYLTEDSIKSKFVERELDVALLSELNDKNISILPYVSEKSLRSRLRVDLQSLQLPEWNKKNYNVVFPQIVAEIWLSYLETASKALLMPIQNEKLKLELELEKFRVDDSAPFTKSEIKEFEFLYSIINKRSFVEVTLSEERTSLIVAKIKDKITYSISTIELLIMLMKKCFNNNSGIGINSDQTYTVNSFLKSIIYNILSTRIKTEKLEITKVILSQFPYLELKSSKLIKVENNVMIFLDKTYRFYHWLTFKKIIIDDLDFVRTGNAIPLEKKIKVR